MALFHHLLVKNICKTTADCSVVELEVPENLRDKFECTQGQYLSFKANINGEYVRRSYSLCTSPLDNQWKVAIKQIKGGLFSTYANNELKVGDLLEVMKPSGNFYIETDPNKAKNYIAFAAGSGITPIVSIIKTHLILEPKSTFKLFYLNSKVKSIILKEEIEQLKNEFFDRFLVFYFLTREQRDIQFLNGRFDEEKLDLLTSQFVNVKETNDCFICGPQEMVFLIRDYFEKKGLKKENIHYELFFTGNQKNDKRIAKILEQKKEGTNVTILDGGKEFHFIMEKEYDNILDGALAAGADLPYACKGGVCSTCKCKVIDGKVEMKVNYALDDKEVAQNFVLSCQAVPLTENVVVDFDV
jgi:ring-1,2-phenylacetyl-CoA epoxidase subunit PaaE